MKLGIAALMMFLAPQQAYAQIWKGGCNEIDLEGTARFEAGSLLLDGFYLGGRRGFVPADSGRHSSCRYRF